MTTQTEAAWGKVQERVTALRSEIARVVVGQEEVVEMMMTALLCKGHCLIVGVPGLAKTLLVSTLGRVLGLKFRRIQFTPDLMPMDIIGSEILQGGGGERRQFEFTPGPIFANLILADEINRTPPKTQAALLEAMQEKQISVSGKTLKLEEPFIVFATQNPIEHEGTYPLPEAQLDRFLFSLNIDYPSREVEREIVLRTAGNELATPREVVTQVELLELQASVAGVPLPENVLDYILTLVQSTRPAATGATDYVKRYVSWGAGPRASQNLARSARALALLRGRPAASIEEVRAVARPVLRHRVVPGYNATGEGIGVEQILDKLLA